MLLLQQGVSFLEHAQFHLCPYPHIPLDLSFSFSRNLSPLLGGDYPCNPVDFFLQSFDPALAFFQVILDSVVFSVVVLVIRCVVLSHVLFFDESDLDCT